jgi:hypothetical protein
MELFEDCLSCSPFRPSSFGFFSFADNVPGAMQEDAGPKEELVHHSFFLLPRSHLQNFVFILENHILGIQAL